jgi:serine/threonine-protein kinase
MNELAGQNLGGYQLEEEIGRGSMGVVYRGKQIALGRDVAIKVLPQSLARDASYIARFIREAQIIAGLNHPNIVHIYDAGQQNKLLYFVMEYVEGPTLASLLHIDGIIPEYLAVEYAAEIADALDAAYKERHVIHRDIKPENLMLNRWGKIKIMDFGLARAPGLQQITIAKTLVGSIYYASPEQVWGHALDNRSDIYALGVVLYEMVCGQRPFTGRSMPELTRAITQGILQPPGVHNPSILPELETIIMTALAKDREQRYEEASLMARQLRALNLQPPQLPQLPPPPALSQSSLVPHAGNKRVVVQPPKRPTMQQPRYFDIDIEQAQPSPLSRSLPGNKATSASPNLPGSTSLITSANLEQGDTPHHIQPTVNSNKSLIIYQGEAQKTSQKRSFWQLLQRFFKRPSR